MITEDIINNILENELSEAKSATEILLYNKLGERLEEMKNQLLHKYTTMVFQLSLNLTIKTVKNTKSSSRKH